MSATYRLAVSDDARADLVSIRKWLLQPGSGRRSHGRYISVLTAIESLKTSPHRWPVGAHDGVRERAIEGHRIYYRIDDDRQRVRILRVFSPYQDRTSL